MKNTNSQFISNIKECKKIFVNKLYDYGLSWKIFRLTSLTDQILIKANRIKNIEIKKEQQIDDDIYFDYIGIINYSVISLIILNHQDELYDLTIKKAIELYDKYSDKTLNLMIKKNSDYGEIWRDMRISSYTDLILAKLFRIKQIENNTGQSEYSEGIENSYYDMINYSVFALIRLNEK